MGSNSKRHSGTTFGRQHGHPPAASKASTGSLRRRGKCNVTLVAGAFPTQSDSPLLPAAALDRSDSTQDSTKLIANAPPATCLPSTATTSAETALAIITNGKAFPTNCPSLAASTMTGLIRIYLPSSLGTNSLQSAIDLLIQPAQSSAGSKMPAFTFRPVPKSSLPSMDAPHVLMDYVSLRKLVTMRKELLVTDHCERHSAGSQVPPDTSEMPSPSLPPELDLEVDSNGQELVWMMEFASSESGDSAVMSGSGCGESTHVADDLVEDEESVAKIVELVDGDVAQTTDDEFVTPHLLHNATVFESLTELDALPPLPDSPASSIFGEGLHVSASSIVFERASDAMDNKSTVNAQSNQPNLPTDRATRTSNATLASSPILKETDLTPVASPTMDAITCHDRPESPMSPGDEALALDQPTSELAPALTSPIVSAAQSDHVIVESQPPLTASAVEAAPVMPRTFSEPISSAPTNPVFAQPPVSRVASDSGMATTMTSPASADVTASTVPRESVDLGSSTMRTTKSSKSSLFKRFSQSFASLARTSKHEKQRDAAVVPPMQTVPASSLSMPRSVDMVPAPSAESVVPPARAEDSAKVSKKKSKLFSSLFGGKSHNIDEEKAEKNERKAQQKAEKAARKEAKRVAKALTS